MQRTFGQLCVGCCRCSLAHPYEVNVLDKKYQGEWRVNYKEKMLEVSYKGRTKPAHLQGTNSPENLARIVLGQLIREVDKLPVT
jgi:hypothetical protein